MKLSIKEFMNHHNVNTKPIILVLIGLGFVSVILVATMIAAAQNMGGNRNAGNSNQVTNIAQTTLSPLPDGIILAVVEKLDTENKQITLFDVNRKEAIALSYSGGTNITDRYGQLISMSQISLGMMVDAAYDQDKYKLTGMNISTRAWEYPNVNNLSINSTDQIMKIASTKYKYNDDIFVQDGDDIVTVANLAEQDVLTVWGYEETIWSISVTKGHGLVTLKNYDNYLGDNITIGYESMVQITEDLQVSVREGTYNLTVENGLYSATKSVTVERNQVTCVTLDDLGPVGLKQGSVTFEITPFEADLYVDGTLTSYSDPVELNYGKHTIVASLGGYSSFEGTIDIDSEAKDIKISLPEATSNNEAVATETDTTSGSGTTTSNTDTNTSTDDTGTDGSTDNTEYASEDTEYTLGDGDSVDKDHKMYIKTPDGASVYLDGEYMGTAPCKFDKIIGTHVLTFIKDGYETTSYTVQVTDDGLDAYFTFPSLAKAKK